MDYNNRRDKNFDEFRNQRIAIDDDYKAKIDKLDEKWRKKLNPYSIGDIITNGTHTIKIERIEGKSYFPMYGLPYCHYYGTQLTEKGLIPKKTQNPNCYISQLGNNITLIRRADEK